MIITRTAFRVSLAGGGSDLAAFYTKSPGLVISHTINKYMYISVNENFEGVIRASYSKYEEVTHAEDLEHPLIKACLQKVGIDKGITISSVADIPAGTGLGSSSSFTVGLLHALYRYKNITPTNEQLAREACEIEIDICKSPIGKQDQYAAAYGGFNCIEFNTNGSVKVSSYPEEDLFRYLMFFYIGETRDANTILKYQTNNLASNIDNLHKTVEITNNIRLGKTSIGTALHELWNLKKALSPHISNPHIDQLYDKAKRAGATGGKLLGAGGSGFLMFYVEPAKQKRVETSIPLRRVYFGPEHSGSIVIYES